MRLCIASLETAEICSFYQRREPNETALDVRKPLTVAGGERVEGEDTMAVVLAGRRIVR